MLCDAPHPTLFEEVPIARMEGTPPNQSNQGRVQSTRLWQTVKPKLLQYAIPDSRFHDDFENFVPNFHGSSKAAQHITNLACYETARVIFATSDNSLEPLRFQALKDGKKLLVATYNLRRGFILIDPVTMKEDRMELASCLDGMERPGIGRRVTLAQLRDEGIKLDLFVTGTRMISTQGMELALGAGGLRPAWCVLVDMGLLDAETPTVIVAHDCQVVDDGDTFTSDDFEVYEGENLFQCDFVVTPEGVRRIEGARKPELKRDWLERMDVKMLSEMPPLQELRGIKMMERIMQSSGFVEEKRGQESGGRDADEQLGIDIVERIMRGSRS